MKGFAVEVATSAWSDSYSFRCEEGHTWKVLRKDIEVGRPVIQKEWPCPECLAKRLALREPDPDALRVEGSAE